MALRPAPKRKVDLEKIDDLQKEIFGSDTENAEKSSVNKREEESMAIDTSPAKMQRTVEPENDIKDNLRDKTKQEKTELSDRSKSPEGSGDISNISGAFGTNLSDMATIAASIASSRAGQGRITTRPFSLPRTLIIDTTRLKAKFRTIEEQFTQNVIVDFLLREALAVATPENYTTLRGEAFEFIKRAEETTRRSLTVTEEVVYLMSELKAGINLETGKKYSNDEIFSTLLAIGVSWLYQNEILS